MNKRLIISVACISLIANNCFAQSKLMDAAKSVKVGVVHTPTKKMKTESTPQVKRKSTPTKVKTVSRTVVSADQKYAKTAYMEITGMVFANTDFQGHIIDDYGSDLYSKDISYLKPKLYYRGLCQKEKEVRLDIKVFENGNLMTNSKSPSGYSYYINATVNPEEGQELELSAWGNKTFTIYDAGYYKIEVWYNGNMLYQKGINIKSGSSPIVYSNILSINSVDFANVDKDDNILTDYGNTLYADEMRYLKARINYNGLVASDQNVKILVRIIDSEGNLKSGKDSPIGFTFENTITVKPGMNNIIPLSGWGNSTRSSYEEGSGIYQIWIGESKIFQGKFEINKKPGIASYLTVDSKTELSTTFEKGGGAETFYVKTDGESWDIAEAPIWCHIKNKDENSFELECAKNQTGSSRIGYLMVKSDSKEVKITIRQN